MKIIPARDQQKLKECEEIIVKNLDGLDGALKYLRKAIQKYPTSEYVTYLLLSTLFLYGLHEEMSIRAKNFLNKTPFTRRIYSFYLFTLQFMPVSTTQSILLEHQKWNKRVASSFLPQIPTFSNDSSLTRRLKIAYLSPNFGHDHCQLLFTWPLFRHHNHKEFEIFCYSLNAKEDDRLKPYVDHWKYVGKQSDEEIAAQIRQDQIDILVDLTMHMYDNRILVFAQKPAPVQVAWLAYPGTTGLAAMDYRISDPYLDPPEEKSESYTEKTICLPHTFWCYDPGLLDGPEPGDPGPLPAIKNKAITFGELNSFGKVNQESLQLWIKILDAIPGSRLIMLSNPVASLNKILKKRFGDRIELITSRPRYFYLQKYQEIDIALDTLPANGHTTSLDAYWMGVPVPTLVGKTVTGRAGFSHLHNLELTELIAWNEEEYIEIIKNLANDLPRLIELRATLRERLKASPIMNATQFTKDLEDAYRKMWQTWVTERGN